MRFLLYTTGDNSQPSAPPAPPSQKMMEELAALTEDTRRSGVLLATGGLGPSSTRVRYSAGKLSVTDGPFTETKELVAGFAIVEAASKQEAIELAKRFLQVVGEGESEIRLMHDAPAFDPAAEPGERETAGAGPKR